MADLGGAAGRFEAVIFDWGGTLTPWHQIDFDAEAFALAAAVAGDRVDRPAATLALRRAADVVWRRSRDEHRSARIEDVFAEARLEMDHELLTAYADFWEPHTPTDPEVGPLFETLRASGLKVGVLSNTIWPRHWHTRIFERDGVYDLIDGDVYSSELAWTKPAPEAFEAAMVAVGVEHPERCVFVGDRPFDDIWGARAFGMHTVLIPHSDIPAAQIGHSEGTPHAVAHRLSEIPSLLGTI